MTVLSLFTKQTTDVNEKPNLEISERSPSPNYHTNLKEFFGTTSHSDNSSEDTILASGN